MSVRETYSCPKCHRSVTLTGPSKPALLAHFQQHVSTCPGPPPAPPTRQFHVANQNGQGLLTRLFKRPSKRAPLPVESRNPSTAGIAQMLADLEALDDAYMTELSPAPPTKAKGEVLPIPLGAPASLSPEPSTDQFPQFDFDQSSAIKNFQEFQKVREYFLLRNRVVALTDLYSVFFLSFVDYYFGYGMDDHKKHNWILGMSEIREDVEQLKGRARQGIWDPDYEGIIELDLNIKFEAMITAHTMDSKSTRATEKHERLIELAKATIAQSEEKHELRNLIDELDTTPEGAP